MGSSDDFRKQLKAGNITEALAQALSEAIELKITTWVASAADDGEAAEEKPGHRLRTYINMLDGHIENEIGEQFLGNGPYRELQQFHLDQVAQGNQIIQNNLKSLQKLFEILVTMRHQAATTPVIEPDVLSVEGPILPSTEARTDRDTELANDPTSFVVTPLTPQQGAMPQWAHPMTPTESAVEESAVRPDTLGQETVTQEPPSPSETPVVFLTTPTDNIQELEEEADEDDWDDSVLDLLESLPVRSPSASENLDSEFDEDRRNLIADTPESDAIASDLEANQDWGIIRREDFESPPASSEPHNESLNSRINEDGGNITQEKPEPSPPAPESQVDREEKTLTQENFLSPSTSLDSSGEASNPQVRQDWGWGDLVAEELAPHPVEPNSPVATDGDTLIQKDVPSHEASPDAHIQVSNSQSNEDWGDILEEEPELNSDKSIPSLDSLDLEEDEEWDEWVVEEPESLRDEPIANLDTVGLAEDEDWGNLEDEPDLFASAPTLQGSVPDLEFDEDWDDWPAEELEPDATLLPYIDANITDAGLSSSASLKDTNSVELEHHPTEHPNVSEKLQTDSSPENSSPDRLGGISKLPAKSDPRQDITHHQKDVVLGEPGQQKTQPDSAILDDKGRDSWEDGLSARRIDSENFSADAPHVTNSALIPEDSYRGDLINHSDPQAISEDDMNAQQKPFERRVPPPPPPPRRFPHQNK